MSIKAIVFDLGGVIVRTQDGLPRQRLASRLGITPGDLYRLIFDSETARQATLGAISMADHWLAVQQTLKLGKDGSSVLDEFWAGDEVDFELVDYIRSLRLQFRTALLSNAWDNMRRVMEEEWGFSDAFDEIIISAEVGIAKPDERIYQYALRLLAVQPQEAIFVDDMLHNVAAAQAQGWHAIQFQSLSQVRQQIDLLVNSQA